MSDLSTIMRGSTAHGTDAWAKYAWYYRYRSLYQEEFSLEFIRRFILPDGRIIAPRGGRVVGAQRSDTKPAWAVTVRYDGDSMNTTIPLDGQSGDFPYVLLFDPFEPNNVFAAGDVIAGRLAVPEGIQVEVQQVQQGYYMQFVPVLQRLQDAIRSAGHADAILHMGEDVSQLDMVACASPRWNKAFLVGTDESVNQIVDNCVRRNAWVIKQLIQSQPKVLYVVSEVTWNVLRTVLGAYVRRDPPLSTTPLDGDYTLLCETTDPNHPCHLIFDLTIGGHRYQSSTRLVITPHFSYNDNFLPQFRLSQADWNLFQQTQAACVAALTSANGFGVISPAPAVPNGYVAVQLLGGQEEATTTLAWLARQFPAAYEILRSHYYNPHAMMAEVLEGLYAQGSLAWKDADQGNPGHLVRAAGSCRFCVNEHWQFPLGCPYDKPREEPPPHGFLEQVAQQVIATSATLSVVREEQL